MNNIFIAALSLTALSSAAQTATGTFKVQANDEIGTQFVSPHTNSQCQFIASGVTSVWGGSNSKTQDANGDGSTYSTGGAQWYMNSAPAFSLIVKHLDGQYDFIGAQKTISTTSTDILLFKINDAIGSFSNNSGTITINYSCQALASSSINDTGQTNCYSANNAVIDCSTNSNDSLISIVQQDGYSGRDILSKNGLLTKTGGGITGFDYSRICWNGALEGSENCKGSLIPNSSSSPSASLVTDWACTKDNVTGLVWSLQSIQTNWSNATTASFSNPGHNSVSRCGYSSGWRIPSRRELLSLVHYGASVSPLIDTQYFPNTFNEYYWSLETYIPTPSWGWSIYFANGGTGARDKSHNLRARLVHSSN